MLSRSTRLAAKTRNLQRLKTGSFDVADECLEVFVMGNLV